MPKKTTRLNLRTSIFRLSVRHLAFITFALLAILPTLALLRMAVLLFINSSPASSQTFEIAALAIFAGLCYISGFHCLYAIVKRIKSLHRQSFQLRANDRFENLATVALGGSGIIPKDSESNAVEIQNSFNEFESLTGTLTNLQDQIAQNLSRVRDQAFFLNQLEYLLDDSQDIAVITDAENNVLFSNRAARNILGIEADQPLRYAFQEGKLEAEDISRTLAKLEEWKTQTAELSFTDENDRKTTFQVSFRITSEPDSEPSKILVMRDISAQKRLERQLYRSEKLATLGQLISGVAHELNNPLAAILGFAELCQDSSLSRKELDGNLEIIEREARRTGHIVENLLNFSRQRQTQRTAVDVHELLERCFNLLSYNFRNTGIIISRDYDATLPHIALDEYQMQQVFMNLIVNSAQAMKEAQTESPKIFVSTHLTHDEKQLVVELADNGPGIPQEYKDKVFTPFFTTKDEDEGTGLGLPVSLSIVKEHGGNILLHKTKNTGTCFKIVFPLPEETVVASQKKPSHTVRRQLTGRILAVDDEPSLLKMTKTALAKSGLEVVTASTVKEALAALAQEEFDMLLVDMYLPDGNGMEIWGFLQNHQPQLASNLVFMTGDPRVRKKIAARLGMEAPLLLKPFHVNDLYETVRKHLGEDVTELADQQPKSQS
ncbi:MAG: ATP-binding protein [Lentisphaeria bacterium]